MIAFRVFGIALSEESDLTSCLIGILSTDPRK